MARGMKRRYDDGGEIVVTGNSRKSNIDADAVDRIMQGAGATGYVSGLGNIGGGGGGSSQRLPMLNAPMTPATQRMVTPAVVSQPQSALGNLVGARVPTGYGARARFGFAEGGEAKAKAKPKVKKMAKGGSTASKRADGCATKGKTKGRFV